jgi:peptide/nickel transport system permease protein
MRSLPLAEGARVSSPRGAPLEPHARVNNHSGLRTQDSGLNPRLIVGLTTLAVFGLVALLAGVLAPFDPSRTVGPPLQPPSERHWMGTDDLGRDLFSNVVHGSRVSLLVGLAVAVTSALLGTLVGSLAGYFGHLLDDLLMRLAEVFQVVPRFFLALIVTALFGPSIVVLTLLLGLTFWPITARLLRAQIFSIRERDYVLAARAIGASHRRVLLRHVLPNAISVVVVATTLQVGTAILVEAGLSFLGLGDRSVVSWGNILNGAQPLIRIAWWTSVFPGLAITLTVVAANLCGDGLNAALNPRQRRR